MNESHLKELIGYFDKYPLIDAIYRGHNEIAKLLISDRRININVTSKGVFCFHDYTSPIEVAVKCRNDEIAEILLKDYRLLISESKKEEYKKVLASPPPVHDISDDDSDYYYYYYEDRDGFEPTCKIC